MDRKHLYQAIGIFVFFIAAVVALAVLSGCGTHGRLYECVSDWECDDGVDCTRDGCGENHTCEALPDSALCGPDEMCNRHFGCVSRSEQECAIDDDCESGLVCDDGVCAEPEPVPECETDEDCDEPGYDCNADSCVGGVCEREPDDDLCTGGYVCDGGECVAEPECVDDDGCDDGIGCTDDLCVAGNCVYAGNCASGRFCTAGYGCVECVGDVGCDDGYVCNNGHECVAESEPPECVIDTDCADGYVCDGGECVAEPEPPECVANDDCDDGLFCTLLDDCNSLGECVYATRSCDDGLSCTTDTCQESGCAHRSTCASGRFCTADHGCVECVDNNGCDDEVDCTINQCVGHHCAYEPEDGECGVGEYCSASLGCWPTDAPECEVDTADTDCNDGVDCTDEVCLEGVCLHAPMASRCDDDMDCTDDICAANGCVHTSTCVADHYCAADGCVECIIDDDCDDGYVCDEDGECVVEPECADNDDCNDSLFCTLESCNILGECVYATRSCYDGVGCTTDTCYEFGCVHTSFCVSGSYCTADHGCVECRTNADCDDGETCASHECVATTTDGDGDGVPDDEDNCPDEVNASQADFDFDGIGDVCDCDADNDFYFADTPECYGNDCNDQNPQTNPGADEICGNSRDDDCDGRPDSVDLCV